MQVWVRLCTSGPPMRTLGGVEASGASVSSSVSLSRLSAPALKPAPAPSAGLALPTYADLMRALVDGECYEAAAWCFEEFKDGCVGGLSRRVTDLGGHHALGQLRGRVLAWGAPD